MQFHLLPSTLIHFHPLSSTFIVFRLFNFLTFRLCDYLTCCLFDFSSIFNHINIHIFVCVIATALSACLKICYAALHDLFLGAILLNTEISSRTNHIGHISYFLAIQPEAFDNVANFVWLYSQEFMAPELNSYVAITFWLYSYRL